MESPTPFDLNEAIRRWRAGFDDSSSLSAEELEELETHLRDHIAALAADGLAAEAAFAASVEQLGEREQVTGEFAKINPRRLWLERAIWMVAGIAFFFALRSFSGLVSVAACEFVRFAGWHPVLRTAVFVICLLGSMAGLIVLCWRLCNSDHPWIRWFETLQARRPVRCGVLLLGTYLATFFANWAYMMALSRYLSEANQQASAGQQSTAASGWGMIWLWHVTLPEISWRLLRVVFLAHAAYQGLRISDRLKPGGAWLAKNSVWVGRFCWMTLGSLLFEFMAQLLSVHTFLWMRAANSMLNDSKMWPHLFGLSGALLEAAFWVFPLWASWYLTVRQPVLAERAERTLRSHPAVSFIALATLLLIASLLRLLNWPATTGIVDGDFKRVVFGWMAWASSIFWVFLPPALLVILLRLRTKLARPSPPLAPSQE